MVSINGITYEGNDLLINNTGTYIDGVAIGNCKRIVKSYKKPIGWFQKFKNFFIGWNDTIIIFFIF